MYPFYSFSLTTNTVSYVEQKGHILKDSSQKSQVYFMLKPKVAKCMIEEENELT